MAYYPDMSPGDVFRPSARRENDISHLLNRMNGNRGGKNPVHTDVLTVQVYNAGNTALPYGAAVEFVSSGAVMAGDLIPCSAASDTSRQWGVLTTALAPGQGGTCVVAGPVRVAALTGSGGAYAVPVTGSGAIVSGAQVYSRGGDGAPILFANASGGVILLGAGRGGGGSWQLTAVVTPPTSGGGTGTVSPVTLGSGGALVPTSGANISVVLPFLDGYN